MMGYNVIMDNHLVLLCIYVSESDILGPISNLSDIEILVSFERAMFEEYSFNYRTKISYCQYYHIEVNA